MAFRRVEITEDIQAEIRLNDARAWLSDPVARDDSTDAWLYWVRQPAGKETIDQMIFQEAGELTLIHTGGKVWGWSPGDHMSRAEVRRKHHRILGALDAIDSTIPLHAYPRPKDLAFRSKAFLWMGMMGYLAVVVAMMCLTFR